MRRGWKTYKSGIPLIMATLWSLLTFDGEGIIGRFVTERRLEGLIRTKSDTC